MTKLAHIVALELQDPHLYAQAKRLVVPEKRHRLAAELHDGLGQTLSYLGLMNYQTMEYLPDGHNQAVLERLRKTRETIDETVLSVRRAINDLMEESPPVFYLQVRLQNATEEFKKGTSLRVQWMPELESTPDCSRQVAEQNLNVMRESLKNILRNGKANFQREIN